MNRKAIADTGFVLLGAIAMSLGHRLRSPVFVIGTGRCGTTLVARILNSHGQLVGFPREANDLWHPKSYPFARRSIDTPPIVKNPRRFTEISRANWPQGHPQRLQRTFVGYHVARGPAKAFFVKSAMISFMIPNILSIFPDGRFIHVYRSGPSVVRSLVEKEWEKSRAYFGDKREYTKHCASYWSDCLLEIERQRVALSLESRRAFLEFSYESLCDSPGEILTRMAGFLSVSPDGFTFDITQISSRNYKAGDYTRDENWLELVQLMSPGMKQKGYLS